MIIDGESVDVFDSHRATDRTQLLLEAPSEARAGDAGRKPWVVLDPERVPQKSAGISVVEHNWAHPASEELDRRRDSGGPGADDRDVVGCHRSSSAAATSEQRTGTAKPCARLSRLARWKASLYVAVPSTAMKTS